MNMLVDLLIFHLLSLLFRITGCLMGACVDISTANSDEVSPEDAVLTPASSLIASEN